MKIKQGDKVIVIAGKDKGKEGTVTKTLKNDNKVIVEGVNIVSKHVKPRRAGQEGGIVKTEGAMYACKVQLVCPNCNKPTRVAHKVNDGTKERVCKICGKSL